MTLRYTWDSAVNEFRTSSVNKWTNDTINTSTTNKCKISIFLDTWIPPIFRRFSGVFLYDIPKDCGREIKSIFDRQGNITLNQIIEVLISHGCRPKVINGDKPYGYTKSITDFNECIWHIHLL